MSSPLVLCILDGFGLNPNTVGNAIAQAKKPNFEKLWNNNPHTTLITHGERVGLPEGQMGNSEVGHMNIGAGRVVDQWLLRISRGLKKGEFENSAAFKQFQKASQTTKTIHLVGLLSDGGVHSHSEHAILLVQKMALLFPKAELAIHVITDGRDTQPQKGASYIAELEAAIKSIPLAKIASITGRFFAMDRDNRWERVASAYEAMILGQGQSKLEANSPQDLMQKSYAAGVTDEFIESYSFRKEPASADDAIVFWNFREDRMREIVAAFCTKDFSGFPRTIAPFAAERVLCFTAYDHRFHLPTVFAAQSLNNHLGEVVSNAGLKQLRVAETEKYPHVTYFLNGGIETPYPGEDRTVVPSPRDVKTYDLKPEMSAEGVCAVVIDALQAKKYDLIVVNFANCDMVGHTGSLAAATKAVEAVDACLGKWITALQSVGGKALIFADHGNAEQMVHYQDNSPHTAHTTYPVPLIFVGGDGATLSDGGALCDVAPTALALLGVTQPVEMTGRSLVKK